MMKNLKQTRLCYCNYPTRRSTRQWTSLTAPYAPTPALPASPATIGGKRRGGDYQLWRWAIRYGGRCACRSIPVGDGAVLLGHTHTPFCRVVSLCDLREKASKSPSCMFILCSLPCQFSHSARPCHNGKTISVLLVGDLHDVAKDYIVKNKSFEGIL
jgi:hypothetical protein